MIKNISTKKLVALLVSLLFIVFSGYLVMVSFGVVENTLISSESNKGLQATQLSASNNASSNQSNTVELEERTITVGNYRVSMEKPKSFLVKNGGSYVDLVENTSYTIYPPTFPNPESYGLTTKIVEFNDRSFFVIDDSQHLDGFSKFTTIEIDGNEYEFVNYGYGEGTPFGGGSFIHHQITLEDDLHVAVYRDMSYSLNTICADTYACEDSVEPDNCFEMEDCTGNEDYSSYNATSEESLRLARGVLESLTWEPL